MDKATRILATLADPIRLRCLALIAEKGELCVCELVTALELAQPKVSRHLAVMRDAGLLRDRRDAQWVLYSFDPALEPAMTAIVTAAVAAVAGDGQAKKDRTRLSRSSRPERTRIGRTRPETQARRVS
ncbi:MAG: metalloregulator ArsR/SmtB family transcription factor [Hyphomicrobiaceae bacterium]